MWHPAADPTWVAKNKTDLIAYGRICSRFLSDGSCNRGAECSFSHTLPDRIDLDSAEWAAAVKKGAEYRERRRAQRELQQAPPPSAPATVASGVAQAPAAPVTEPAAATVG